MRIGLLEDDINLVEIMSLWIENDGNHVVAYTTGKLFREGVPKEKFDVLILDWHLPDTTGFDELNWVREKLGSDTPVIFITSRDDEKSIIEALNHGADDFLTKPVNRQVTMARINALHRRNNHTGTAAAKEGNKANLDPNTNDGIEIYEPYQISQSQRSITVNGVSVKLTNKEFELAAFMFRHESSLISRDDLLEFIWGTRAEINTRTIDTHISRIRTKLSINADIGWQLNSIYQCGYRLFRVQGQASQ